MKLLPKRPSKTTWIKSGKVHNSHRVCDFSKKKERILRGNELTVKPKCRRYSSGFSTIDAPPAKLKLIVGKISDTLNKVK